MNTIKNNFKLGGFVTHFLQNMSAFIVMALVITSFVTFGNIAKGYATDDILEPEQSSENVNIESEDIKPESAAEPLDVETLPPVDEDDSIPEPETKTDIDGLTVVPLLMHGGGYTINRPLIITTPAQLAEIAALTNLGKLKQTMLGAPDETGNIFFALGNDISLGGAYGAWGEQYEYIDEGSATSLSSQHGWMPIGNNTNTFSGHFDGRGYVISDLHIDRTDDNSGLFGVIGSGGVVKNIGVTGSIIGANNVGAIAGTSSGEISNVYNTAKITGTSKTGGILGEALSGAVISNVYNTGAIIGGENAGGIVGSANNGEILDVYNTGTVEADINVGGILGKAVDSGVHSSVSLGFFIKGSADIGRIVGMRSGDNSFGANRAWEGIFDDSSCGNIYGADTDDGINGIDVYFADIVSGTDFWEPLGISSANGWTVEFGKLPILSNILSGQSNIIPPHIIDELFTERFPGNGIEGDINNPYEVSTADELACFARHVNSGTDFTDKYIKLTADIDLGGKDGAFGEGRKYNEVTGLPDTTGSQRGWTPIGLAQNESFDGTFDGNGYTISNLYINRTMDYSGLFGFTEYESTIRNLGLIDVDITSTSSFTGGIVGGNRSAISYAYVTGSVHGGSFATGGITGGNWPVSISNVYNAATIYGQNYVGGITGAAGDENGVSNSYNIGSIKGTDSVGGIVGHASGSLTLQNNVSLGTSVNATNISANVGRDFGILENTYGDPIASNNYAWEGITDGKGCTNYLLAGVDTDKDGQNVDYEDISSAVWWESIGFNATNGWIVQDWKLPILDIISIEQNAEIPAYIRPNVGPGPFADGIGTQDSPYEISTASQLACLAESTNLDDQTSPVYADKYYKLTTNIDLYDYKDDNNGEGWTPIGMENAAFKGYFDGDDYVITNLFINRPDQPNIGLFGVSSGIIENVGIMSGNIDGGEHTGGIVGLLYGSTISNTFNNANITSTSLSSNNEYGAGGIAGQSVNGAQANIITNSYNNGNISGEYAVGGIVGRGASLEVLNSYNTGDIFGDRYVGGVVAITERTEVSNAYNTGSIYASGNIAGGIVGSSFMQNDNIFSNTVSLGESIIIDNHDDGSRSFGRIGGFGDTGATSNNNYAWEEELVNDGLNGANIILDGQLDNNNGEDITSHAGNLTQPETWESIFIGNPSEGAVWAVEDEHFPRLDNIDMADNRISNFWINQGKSTEPEVYISNLPIGEMRFQLEGSGISGVWPDYTYTRSSPADVSFSTFSEADSMIWDVMEESMEFDNDLNSTANLRFTHPDETRHVFKVMVPLSSNNGDSGVITLSDENSGKTASVNLIIDGDVPLPPDPDPDVKPTPTPDNSKPTVPDKGGQTPSGDDTTASDDSTPPNIPRTGVTVAGILLAIIGLLAAAVYARRRRK